MLGRIAKVFFIGLTVSLLTAAFAAAQAPSTISYQGRLTNAAGQPITTATSVVFAVYAAPTGGTALDSVSQNVTPDANGVFTVELSFIAAVFDGSKRYLGIRAGSDSEMSPRQLLTSAPYSLNTNSIADNAVTSAKIAAGAVGNSDLATNSVTASNIVDGTVGSADLAANAVTTDKIASGAVGNTDIAGNAVDGSKVSDGSLTKADIADEPGLSYAQTGDGNTLVSLTTTGKAFTSVSINAPTSGYVQVTGCLIAFITHTNGTMDNVIFKLSKTSGDVSTPDFATSLIRIPPEWPSSTQYYCQGITLTHMFPVSSGNNIFYLNGFETVNTGNNRVLAPRIMAIFIPSSYGTAPPALSDGPVSPNQPDVSITPITSSGE